TMNYSDYDSDGYSSNEDADYVPSGEDCKHFVLQRLLAGVENKNKNINCHKRGGNSVLKVDSKEEDVGGATEKPQEEVEKLGKEVNKEDEAKQRKKSDELWASFLSDVGSRPKESAPQSDTAEKDEPTVFKTAPLKTETKPSGPAKVTITKVFDFAGEEVRVNKEVSADSKEAKSYLKSQSIKSDEKSLCPCVCSAKRPAGMSSVLNRIGGKKQKMSTLEKSKMDWDAFKSEEGITEELAIHNRGREGYVERKNFLERVDHRQFELEKAVRLSNMKR
uniref:Craniofacial development protein 1 n=1 Tax=Amphilophus citrinellus TaxID=61819 RepID=A0A3Q0SUZ4_AMPCI